MAGGFGTRLRPLTSGIPKPMVPMVNKPIMEHIVELLKNHGIEEIVSTLFYQPDAITGYFGDGSAFGIKMQYRKAEADYGTAGSVRNAKDFLNERFLIISGDVLTDFDFNRCDSIPRRKESKSYNAADSCYQSSSIRSCFNEGRRKNHTVFLKNHLGAKFSAIPLTPEFTFLSRTCWILFRKSKKLILEKIFSQPSWSVILDCTVISPRDIGKTLEV